MCRHAALPRARNPAKALPGRPFDRVDIRYIGKTNLVNPAIKGARPNTNAPGDHSVQRSRRLVEQFPPDQHAADLAGAGADFVELGIAPAASSRVVCPRSQALATA